MTSITNKYPELKVYLHQGDMFLYEAVDVKCKMFGISVRQKYLQLPKPTFITADEGILSHPLI